MVLDRNGCVLHTFRCLEWEPEVYRGVMLIRCYPFNLASRCESVDFTSLYFDILKMYHRYPSLE